MTAIKLSLFALAVALAFSQTACLKTRSQIKNNDQAEQGDAGGDDARGAPAKGGGRYELEEIKHEVTRLSGKLDDVEHAQRTQNAGELKEYVTRLDGRIAELEKNQVLVLSELKALKDEKTAAAREAAIPVHELFAEANRLLAEKKYEEAADKFRSILGKGAKGKEASDAHYGLGEALYGLKDYKKAIVQYSKVQETYAKSARVPASLYRIGLSFQRLNMPKESRNFFSELVERYPKSPEAKKARAKVKE